MRSTQAKKMKMEKAEQSGEKREQNDGRQTAESLSRDKKIRRPEVVNLRGLCAEGRGRIFVVGGDGLE